MRAFKFVNGIDLDNNNKKYNPAEVLIDLNNSDISELLDPEEPLIPYFSAKATLITVVCQIRTKDSDILDKLCILYVESKSTRIV